jgi:hypothetical protein
MIIIEHPITGDKIQVANKNFDNLLTWHEAKKACKELGNGWRLPSMDELKTIYKQLHIIGKGNFEVGEAYGYWSSTELDSEFACYLDFGNGNKYSASNEYQHNARKEYHPNYVRAVRSL